MKIRYLAKLARLKITKHGKIGVNNVREINDYPNTEVQSYVWLCKSREC
jgi:hypothetical protein